MLGEYFTPSNYIMLDYGGRQKTLNHLLSQLSHHWRRGSALLATAMRSITSFQHS